jgi:hypothetical protein
LLSGTNSAGWEDVRTGSCLRTQQVLGEQDPDHVVVTLVENRVAGVAVLANPRLHLLDCQGVAHEHHVGARHLDLPDLGALEAEHRLEHPVLDLGEMAFLAGNRKQETHVLRARRRGGAVQRDAAKPGDQVGETQQHHQHRGQQQLEPGDGHDDPARDRFWVAARQGLWRHLAEHEDGKRGDPDRDPDTLVAVDPE